MEWFSEIIGFLIVLFVFLLPLLRKLLIDRKKKKTPQPEQEEEEVEEEEEYEIEEQKPLPQPLTLKKTPTQRVSSRRLVKKDFEFEHALEQREFETRIEERELETLEAPKFKERIVSEEFILAEPKKRRKSENPIVWAVQHKDPLQAMVILSEILGSPKGLE